jgi:inosine-uridine nucleoside N-ribohydrolase
MPFPNPDTQFKPKPDGTQFIRVNVMLRPDQIARLKLEKKSRSAVIQTALDAYLTIHTPGDDTDHAAALDAMAAAPAELDEATP